MLLIIQIEQNSSLFVSFATFSFSGKNLIILWLITWFFHAAYAPGSEI